MNERVPVFGGDIGANRDPRIRVALSQGHNLLLDLHLHLSKWRLLTLRKLEAHSVESFVGAKVVQQPLHARSRSSHRSVDAFLGQQQSAFYAVDMAEIPKLGLQRMELV